MALMLVGAVAGDPRSDRTQSGVATGVFDALERLGVGVARVDTSIVGFRKALSATTCPSFPRGRWAYRLHQGIYATSARTRILEKELIALPSSDAVLLIRSVYRPLGRPYMPFLDTTLALMRREWPPWLPWSPATQELLVAAEADYLRGAAHVFVVGKRAATSVATYGIPPSRITVVGGGTSWPVANASVVRGSGPVALLVGRDFRRKGGDILLEAFSTMRRRLPQAVLRIVGDAPSRVPDGVEVLGHIADRAELMRVYRSARVCVLPALFEPYGLVLLEAMTQGVPCIGSDVGAMPEIIHDGTDGTIVQAGDVDALTEALESYLGDPALAEQHGEAARQRVAGEFTWDRVAERIVLTANDVLG